MKKLLLTLLVLFSFKVFAQVKSREAVPEINFKTVLNAPVKSVKLSQLKGKIVLIDFWATWCGSCLIAMPHLKELQKKYTNKLQIMTVTNETIKRTKQYLTIRPSNLWFAVDTERVITKLFPHQLIPHTVLISGDGNLIANTLPESVTDKVIDSVLHKQKVHLPEKKDLQYSSPEYLIKSLFYAADTVKNRFLIQGEIKGAPGLSTAYITDSLWNGRRITAINCSPIALYRVAYGKFPYGRIIDKTNTDDNLTSYCLDIIVENKKDLLPTLQKELLKRFDVQAKLGSEVKEVYVLKIADQEKFKKITINTSGKRTYSAQHGEIDQQNITMTDFAEYLEDYGISKGLVVDETQSKEKYDVKFSFQPENQQSLIDILTSMGLSLNKEQRKIAILYIYKENTI